MNNIDKPILVIGGGISGITAAVEIAEVGYKVVLVEKEAFLGGNVIRMNNYFPKLCPPACGLEINFRRIRQNPRIQILTSSTVEKISGEKGNYKVALNTRPEYVSNYCTVCGKCETVCPEERPNAFNYNLNNTKAIYLPHEMAFPMKYTIDEKACKKENCNKCVEVCAYNAIDFKAQETHQDIEVHSVISATGWKNYDAGNIENYHYKQFEDVVTNVEMERLLAENGFGEENFQRPSDNKQPQEIVFIQCAGSRDINNLSYCSAVCCSASLKQALTISEKYPKTNIKILYIDLRVSGRNEDFLKRVEQKEGISLIKGKAGKIEFDQKTKKLNVFAEDILAGKKRVFNADLVVLATGIVPNNPGFDVDTNKEGFVKPNKKEGFFSIACGRKPMDVSTSVKDATAAALKAIQQ